MFPDSRLAGSATLRTSDGRNDGVPSPAELIDDGKKAGGFFFSEGRFSDFGSTHLKMRVGGKVTVSAASFFQI